MHISQIKVSNKAHRSKINRKQQLNNKKSSIINKLYKMISFEVKKCYTFISKYEALNVLKNKLSTRNNLNSKEINEIIQYIKIIINQNNFQYD